MSIFLLLSVALAGGADVVAAAAVPAAPERVLSVVSDLGRLAALTPESCARDWVLGDVSAGPGGRARWQLRAGPWRERVTGVLVAVAPTHVDLEHRDRKGVARFTSRFRLEPDGAGTRVTLTTYLEPPPWPLARLFERRVRPAWQACSEAVVGGLAASVAP
jgi:carbon monoxide dehydrogenase subunit G